MGERGLVHQFRNKPVRELERALRRDGFSLRGQTRRGTRFYVHPDGRKTDIHYKRSSDTLPRGTLGAVLTATRWTEDDSAASGCFRPYRRPQRRSASLRSSGLKSGWAIAISSLARWRWLFPASRAMPYSVMMVSAK